MVFVFGVVAVGVGVVVVVRWWGRGCESAYVGGVKDIQAPRDGLESGFIDSACCSSGIGNGSVRDDKKEEECAEC
jgi:hypothetical protein